MNERIISRNKRLSSVFERLQRQSLYSIKEFTSPINIVQESNRLIKLRQVNYAGFLREVTNCFPYFLDTSEPRLADPNKLTSIILTLQSPFDPSKWKPSDGVLSYSTILLQDTLLGKNVDFLRGKKESSFIMPAYMILRSLREKNSLWVSGIFLRLKKSQQEKLIIETNELKNRILSSINIPWIKDNVENLLKQTLDFNILKPEGEIEEEKKEEPLSKTVPVALYIKKFDRFADEKLQSTNKPSLEQSAFISAFNKFINIDFSQGKINISPDEELQKRMKIESNYKDFYGIFSDDLDQFAAFTTMSILSSKNNQINLWIKNLEGKKGYYQKIRNITNAFNRSFEDICTNNNVFDNLVDAYKKIISDKRFEDFDNLNFSLLNQKLSALLYSHYPVINKKGQPDIVKLADFLEVPGVKESILALKKPY